MPIETRSLTVEIIDETVFFNLEELCETCRVHAEIVIEMVESGVLEAQGARPAEWRFSGRSMTRFQKAVRLRRDLELNLPGLALSLDLLEDLEALRGEVRALKQQLARLQQS
jgi:chaperone modulatory protein CbpM